MSDCEDKMFEAFRQAAAAGQVECMTGDDLLITDGDTELRLQKDVHLGHGTFGFVMSDGGGFTGLLVTESKWLEMKEKVDAFIKEKKQEIA